MGNASENVSMSLHVKVWHMHVCASVHMCCCKPELAFICTESGGTNESTAFKNGPVEDSPLEDRSEDLAPLLPSQIMLTLFVYLPCVHLFTDGKLSFTCDGLSQGTT